MKTKNKILLASFGDPGHTFPMIALAKELAAKGHKVTIETWKRWKDEVEAEGIGFAAAPEYQTFPTRERPLKPYQAAVRAARVTQELIQDLRPDAVVSDLITIAPALAAELEDLPWATVVPHVYPINPEGCPPYGIGLNPSASFVGRHVWSYLSRWSDRGVELGRRQLNDTRRRLGLPPQPRTFGGISRYLCLVGTFPGLEYPRRWPEYAKVVGPLFWEPQSESAEIADEGRPLVLVAPSTSQDPSHRLLRAAVEGLAGLDVTVLATTNKRPLERPLELAPNASVVDWLSYSQTMPKADLVICHAGHGTLAKALSYGVPVLAVPATGDMPENAARLQWSGAGLSLHWRLAKSSTVRLLTEKMLSDPSFKAEAEKFRSWSENNDGATLAAELIEQILLQS